MFTAFEKERNRCGGAAVAANGRIMREGETAQIIRPFAKGVGPCERALMHFPKPRISCAVHRRCFGLLYSIGPRIGSIFRKHDA